MHADAIAFLLRWCAVVNLCLASGKSWVRFPLRPSRLLFPMVSRSHSRRILERFLTIQAMAESSPSPWPTVWNLLRNEMLRPTLTVVHDPDNPLLERTLKFRFLHLNTAQIQFVTSTILVTAAKTSYCVVHSRKHGTTVAERLACSPTTKTIRVQFPAGPPALSMWESCRTMPLASGFSRGSPVSPASSFPRRPMLTSITLIGSQDQDPGWELSSFHSFRLLNTKASEGGRYFMREGGYGMRRSIIAVVDNTRYVLRGHGPMYCCAVWLDNSPSNHKANWVRFPVGPPSDIRVWESCRTMPLVGRFSRGSPVSPAPSYRRCPMLTSIHPHPLSRPRCYESSKSLQSLTHLGLYGAAKRGERRDIDRLRALASRNRCRPAQPGKGLETPRTYALLARAGQPRAGPGATAEAPGPGAVNSWFGTRHLTGRWLGSSCAPGPRPIAARGYRKAYLHGAALPDDHVPTRLANTGPGLDSRSGHPDFILLSHGFPKSLKRSWPIPSLIPPTCAACTVPNDLAVDETKEQSQHLFACIDLPGNDGKVKLGWPVRESSPGPPDSVDYHCATLLTCVPVAWFPVSLAAVKPTGIPRERNPAGKAQENNDAGNALEIIFASCEVRKHAVRCPSGVVSSSQLTRVCTRWRNILGIELKHDFRKIGVRSSYYSCKSIPHISEQPSVTLLDSRTPRCYKEHHDVTVEPATTMQLAVCRTCSYSEETVATPRPVVWSPTCHYSGIITPRLNCYSRQRVSSVSNKNTKKLRKVILVPVPLSLRDLQVRQANGSLTHDSNTRTPVVYAVHSKTYQTLPTASGFSRRTVVFPPLHPITCSLLGVYFIARCGAVVRGCIAVPAQARPLVPFNDDVSTS
ncbi:hypothetical protein PR048_029911 [Dryococelus australis]|uniref:Uncharacterized protein n=1 Tax=Dryococelus australis TaxID=614101 RepID=A0ABQ9G7I1_9NEOP|nr:hypothetical protein PR048_029911 [Dryococelus australis]